MIITAAMSYFDDDLALLDRCLRSIPIVADRLVVADGRYARYMPGAPAASPKAHHAFIRATCRDIGLPVTIDIPAREYPGQVAKRSRLLDLAADGSDWIVGVDADHIFHGVGPSVRDEIEAVEKEDAIDVDYFTPVNHSRPMSESAAGEWHEGLAGQKARITAFFRALPGLRVERFHWWYSALKGEQRTWIWGGDNTYPRAKVHVLYAPFVVEHACLFREPRHILANRDFCNDREQIVEQTGQEDQLPGERVAA